MANLITVLRTLLAFLAVAMLRWHTWEIYVGAALLTLLLIWMDAWDGWVARRRNETSKAGAVFDILGDRVVGICDTPITMAKRAARLLGIPADAPVDLDYVGLNHLGWLRGLSWDGTDHLARLLADDALLGATEEGQLFGLDWVRELGALPNEYVYYYDFTRDAASRFSSA